MKNKRKIGKRASRMLLSAIAVGIVGCSGVPGYVIKPKDMASLLADMYTAEAVVDVHPYDYRADTSKMQLKKTVLDAHGFSPQKFDTSLVYYAHNIDKYIEIYDDVIEILESRNAQAGNMAAREALSLAGDSVDIWAGSRYLYVTDRMPSRMVTFDITEDDNWEKGDTYTWRMKLIGVNIPEVQWGVVANYSDSTVEYLSSTTTLDGWNSVTFTADTTKSLSRLRGYAQVTPQSRTRVWIDSLELVRKRYSSKGGYPVRIRQHKML